MGREERYSAYDGFAWFYNQYWGGSFVNVVIPVIDKLLLDAVPDGARILDLCCGTGQLAGTLAKRGFRVTGVDASEQMLGHARTNAPGVEFILADVRSLRLPTIYQAAVSTYDSLNHVMDSGELREVFRNVFHVLKEGGQFLFDLNMEEGYRARWRGTYAIVESDNVCIVRAGYDGERRIGRDDITMFRGSEGTWGRTDVTLLQRCYSGEEVRLALKDAGFTNVRTLDAAQDLGMQGALGRSFFLARKPPAGP